MWKNAAELGIIFTKFYTSISPNKKQKLKKSFYIHIQRLKGFSMILLTFLYNDYIGRPKLSEQKTYLSKYFI